MKSITTIIDWYGPYTLEEAQRDSKFDYGDGLYVVIGKLKGQPSTHLQYVGIADDLSRRLNRKHHKIPGIVTKSTSNPVFWLGEVGSPRSPGRKVKVTDRLLDLAEWAHIYFLQIPFNDKKKSRPPDKPIVVYNRWWKKDYETPLGRRPHKEWPDVIDYIDPELNAKMVWFGGKQILQPVHAFKVK